MELGKKNSVYFCGSFDSMIGASKLDGRLFIMLVNNKSEENKGFTVVHKADERQKLGETP